MRSNCHQLLFGLVFWLAALVLLVSGQDDLELDYSNEYDEVRPHLIYPSEPTLDKQLNAAAQEFGENIRKAWQSMVDSFHNYFQELRNVFADGIDDNVETFPMSN